MCDLRTLTSSPRPRRVACAGKEPQNLFQISGVVRAFSPIDRAVLKSKLIELEHETGIRCGIQETDPDPSFSAFSDTEPKTQRLVKTLTR